MIFRPQNSDAGARRSGPKAKPRTYTETTKAAICGFVLLKSDITCEIPGANIDDANGLEMHILLGV